MVAAKVLLRQRQTHGEQFPDPIMTSRDLVISTLNHEPVDRVPRDLWIMPGVASSRADEVAELGVRYPNDIVRPDFKYPPGKRAKGKPFKVGQYTDAWGCTWQVTQPGTRGEVRRPPLSEPGKIDRFTPPLDILSGARLTQVNRSCAATSRFVLAWTDVRPFERLQALRGTDAALADLTHGTKRIRKLLAMLHDFFRREVEMWAETDVDGVAFQDDWGSPDGLLLDRKLWRSEFRPLYRDYCEILHASDKFAFFHSSGNIYEIFDDLVKVVGIDAINCQLAAMNLERLAKRFRGRVTFWGEIDRQQIMPFGTREHVREAVLRVRRALDFGTGGVIAQCRWEPEVPMRNVAAVFEQWLMPLPIHAH